MVLASWYTFVFFMITAVHWSAYHLVYKSDGVKYKDIVDVSKYDPGEYNNTIGK